MLGGASTGAHGELRGGHARREKPFLLPPVAKNISFPHATLGGGGRGRGEVSVKGPGLAGPPGWGGDPQEHNRTGEPHIFAHFRCNHRDVFATLPAPNSLVPPLNVVIKAE